MKRTTLYTLLAVVAVALIALVITGSGKKKKLDERLSFRKRDKIPYGTWVAFQSLPEMFPAAKVYTNRREPGLWETISEDSSNQLFIAVTPKFMAETYEVRKLISFAENGNDVFISTHDISYAVKEILGCEMYDMNTPTFFGEEDGLITGQPDSLGVSLLHPPFTSGKKYYYPGKRFDATFTKINTVTTDVLGEDESGMTNFIHLQAGKGNLYLHLAPLTFSNYFLLHKNNMEYYEKVMSVINPEVKKIVWDEYFIYKENYNQSRKKKSWLSVLSRYPGLQAALITAILTLLVYMLLEMRRKQRYIPALARPKNDSLDFVSTIGRLYYDRSDHKNLCRKMGAYFLEHIRSRYKLPTGNLDDAFVTNLQFKTGVEEQEIRGIVSFIKYIEDTPAVSAAEVTEFHKQLESFYKKA